MVFHHHRTCPQKEAYMKRLNQNANSSVLVLKFVLQLPRELFTVIFEPRCPYFTFFRPIFVTLFHQNGKLSMTSSVSFFDADTTTFFTCSFSFNLAWSIRIILFISSSDISLMPLDCFFSSLFQVI